MGYSGWDSSAFSARSADRAATGKTAFTHDADVRSGKASAIADKANPFGVKMRESRDSANHPESNAIVVLFDVTGSMRNVPKTVQSKLPNLMNLLTKEGWVSDPQILIGAVGDATCDDAPLQVGQFESGIEIDNDLGKLYLEGGGGGQMTESYELGMYWVARHTVTDSWEKRQKKGYLFLMGDETAYPAVKANEVKSVIGDSIQNISTSKIVEELQEKWNVYFIIPNLTSYYRDSSLFNFWTKLLGDNVVKLQDPGSICELIASLIAANEGRDHDDIAATLARSGVSASSIASLSKAIAVVEPVSKGSLPSTGKSRGVVRI